MKHRYYRIALSIASLSAAIAIAAYDAFGPKLSVWLLMRKDMEQKLSSVASEQLSAEDNLEPEAHEIWPRTLNVTVGRGDTLARLLKSQGLSRTQVHEIIHSLKRIYNPQQLQAEHKITLTLDKPPADGSVSFIVKELRIRPEVESEIIIELTEAGSYRAKENKIHLTRELKWVEGEVQGSISEDAIKKGIPMRAIQEMTQVYSYDVDFQRDIQPGDRYGVLFAIYTDPGTGLAKSGELLHASLLLSNKSFKIYRFQPDKRGASEFFNARGESVRKALLRTPVDGARLTSGFGKRRHPMLGYTKHHKGVDFGAPLGTPIRAAGNGLIEQIGRWGAYGNYIRIRHNRTYATAYAHLSRYAKGLKRGKRVCQGQIIGYVGLTGRTSGSHLHYEVLKNNTQINPLTLTFMPTGKLYGQRLEAFNRLTHEVEKHKSELLTAKASRRLDSSVQIKKG
jgi:murein DD-endopeptidase MepM/ murein hydrolase activator NlpD